MNNLNKTKNHKTVKNSNFFKKCEFYEEILIVIFFTIIDVIIVICLSNNKDYPIALNTKEHEYISIS